METRKSEIKYKEKKNCFYAVSERCVGGIARSRDFGGGGGGGGRLPFQPQVLPSSSTAVCRIGRCKRARIRIVRDRRRRRRRSGPRGTICKFTKSRLVVQTKSGRTMKRAVAYTIVPGVIQELLRKSTINPRRNTRRRSDAVNVCFRTRCARSPECRSLVK